MLRTQVTRLSRTAAAASTATMTGRRAFHTSKPACLDLLGFLRSRKQQPGVAPAAPKPEKTSKVIEDIEGRAARNEVSEKLVPVELEVIGLPEEDRSWEEFVAANGGQFEVGAFPTGQVNAELTAEAVEAAVGKAYAEVVLGGDSSADSLPADWQAAEVADLTTRMRFLSHIQLALRTAIPDPQLALLASPAAVHAYFATKVVGRRYNEKEPDAIYLDPKDFEGTNIRIVDAPLSKRQQEAKWQALVEDARKADEEKRAQALSEA